MTHSELETYPLTGRFLMGRLRHAMSEEEKRTIESLIDTTEEFDKPHTVLARGDLADRSTMLIEGFMLRAIVEDGQRHIVGLHVPGDFADLHVFALKRLDHDLVTIGPARVGYVPHERLARLVAEQPHLARLLWFATLLDASIHRQWILRLEQLTAARRAAHVFAELWQRLDFVGLGSPKGVRTPLTQVDLADMCGTTSIHMSRALGQMRKEGAGDFRRGDLRVEDRRTLERFANFRPDYLYGEGQLGVGHALDK